MPARLRDITRPRRVTVRYDLGEDGDINMVLRADAVNVGFFIDWQKVVDKEDADTIVEYYLRTVESWDLLDDEGCPLPVCHEALDAMNLGLVIRMIEVISEALSQANTDVYPHRIPDSTIVA
jgi:hypothetical protein